MTDDLGTVVCPRCQMSTDASGIWVWVDGQGERLRVDDASIRQSGYVDLFDLACGCKFDTTLWKLVVSTSYSLRAGKNVQVQVSSMMIMRSENG